MRAEAPPQPHGTGRNASHLSRRRVMTLSSSTLGNIVRQLQAQKEKSVILDVDGTPVFIKLDPAPPAEPRPKLTPRKAWKALCVAISTQNVGLN
jgi:hypothetical protein